MAESFEVPQFAPLDAAFFNRVLADANLNEAAVVDFRAHQIGTGQMGKCVRFELVYDGPVTNSPRTLVGKFASDSAASLGAAASFESYLREVAFYKHFLGGLSIRTPTCYYAEIKDDITAFVLLLDDLAPAKQGDQLAGCTPAVARQAVLELVGLHAPTWGREDIFAEHPALKVSETKKSEGRAIYAAMVEPFAERFGDSLTAEQLAIIRRAAEVDMPLFTFAEQPVSLIHGDYRLDNLLLTPAETPDVYAVDWQTLTLGNPLADVAYLMSTSLAPEARRSCEQAIVREYHEGLLAAGVTGFDWDACWREYRRMSMFAFPITVIASMMVERTERGDAMFLVMANGSSQMALDLDAGEFFD